MKFIEKWFGAVNEKNSVLCAGLDPAEFEMRRGEKGLPKGVDKKEWSLKYVETVAPYCAGIKPNIQYWKKKDDMNSLKEITKLAHSLGMIVIEDSKLADIGSTNDAGLFHVQEKKIDAVTYSPFAGNMVEAADQAKKWGVGIISMCLMSNPEYEKEKNKLIDVSEYMNDNTYSHIDITTINDVPYVKQYIYLAKNANIYGLDGIVVGAPSAKNHISEKEIEDVKRYSHSLTLVLLPGVGAQGGEANIIWKYFNRNNVIVNVGRAMMFPNGSNSTSEEQAAIAKQYRDMLNDLRTK